LTEKSEIGLLYGLIGKVRAMLLLKEMLREGWIKPEMDYNRFKAQLERVPPEAAGGQAVQSAGVESVCALQSAAAG
jgi:hypothetical protein